MKFAIRCDPGRQAEVYAQIASIIEETGVKLGITAMGGLDLVFVCDSFATRQLGRPVIDRVREEVRRRMGGGEFAIYTREPYDVLFTRLE